MPTSNSTPLDEGWRSPFSPRPGHDLSGLDIPRTVEQRIGGFAPQSRRRSLRSLWLPCAGSPRNASRNTSTCTRTVGLRLVERHERGTLRTIAANSVFWTRFDDVSIPGGDD